MANRGDPHQDDTNRPQGGRYSMTSLPPPPDEIQDRSRTGSNTMTSSSHPHADRVVVDPVNGGAPRSDRVFVVDSVAGATSDGHVSVFDPIHSGLRRLSTPSIPDYSRLPRDHRNDVYDEIDEQDMDGDSLDEDVVEEEDIAAKAECCGEARLNCSRFHSCLVTEGRALKRTFGKIDAKSYCRSVFSMDTLRTRLPIVKWAPKYSLTDLQGDLIAGFTVGLTVIPQSLAYAVLANVPPQYGLYGSFIGSFVYVIFGSAKDITLGPSAIQSLLTGIYSTSPIAGDATFSIAMAFLSGFVLIGMFIFRLGFLYDFLPFSVTKSFVVASAITIALTQVKRWWGQTGVPSQFMPQLYWTVNKIPQSRVWDFVLGVICIIIIVALLKVKQMIKWKRKFRDMPIHMKILKKTIFYLGLGRNIVAIIIATIVSYIFYINGSRPFTTIGYIPPGIPPFKLPSFSAYDPATNKTYTLTDITDRIGAGFVIVPVLALFEGMVIGNVFARRANYRIDPNQELLSYGIGNVLTGFVSGFSITGTFSRTAVNAQSGVRTPAGGIVTGVVVLLALQFLTPVFFYIPNCSIATVIILAVLDTVTFHKIWIFWRTNKIDLFPWIVTIVVAFVVSIEWGVIVGALASLLLLLYPIARPKIHITKQDGSALSSASAVGANDVLIVTFNSGLMYPALEYFKDQVVQFYEGSHPPKGVVLDFMHVSSADTTTVQGMRFLLENYHKKGIPLVVCNLQKPIDSLFRRAKPRFYQQASNVAEAVRLIINESRDVEAVTQFGHVRPTDRVVKALSEVTEASGGVDNLGVVKDVETSYDNSFVKNLVREEAERYIQRSAAATQPSGQRPRDATSKL